MRSCLTLLLLLVSLTAGPAAAAEGTLAPALSLPDARGAVKQMADYAGQVRLIDFWASWCIPCKASFPVLESLHKQFAARGFTVIAVNLDEQRKSADAFLASRPHTMPVLFDPKGTAAVAFKVEGMPSSMLIDRRGVIRYVHMGYTEKTLAEYRHEITLLLEEKVQ